MKLDLKLSPLLYVITSYRGPCKQARQITPFSPATEVKRPALLHSRKNTHSTPQAIRRLFSLPSRAGALSLPSNPILFFCHPEALERLTTTALNTSTNCSAAPQQHVSDDAPLSNQAGPVAPWPRGAFTPPREIPVQPLPDPAREIPTLLHREVIHLKSLVCVGYRTHNQYHISWLRILPSCNFNEFSPIAIRQEDVPYRERRYEHREGMDTYLYAGSGVGVVCYPHPVLSKSVSSEILLFYLLATVSSCKA